MSDEYNDTEETTDKHTELMESFDDFFEHWSEKHDEIRAELAFSRLGDQWDEDALRERKEAGRPCLTFNMLPAFARQVINDARQNKPAIRIHPADDKADVKTAEIMNGLIRNIEYVSDAEVCYDTALENSVYCSWGFWRIDVDYSSYDVFEKDITMERIADPTSVYPDIASTAHDASDWTRCFIIERIDCDEFKRQYPDADEVNVGNTYTADWGDDDEVQVAECYDVEEVEDVLIELNSPAIEEPIVMLLSEYEEMIEEDGEMAALHQELNLQVTKQRDTYVRKIHYYKFTGEEILEEREYEGRYIPIVPCYGEEFVIDGKRHFKSMFYDSMDAQRNYNYWRTSNTETVALQPKAPYVGRKGAFNSDKKKWAQANKKNYPYLEYDGDERPTREPPPQLSQGALSEVSASLEDLHKITGIQPPAMGMQDGVVSGKAVDSWKIESDTSNFHFVDNLTRSMRYAGRVLLDLIPKVYTEARVVRVMGMDEKAENVAINQKTQVEGVEQIFDFTAGKYDLTVEVGASYTTKRRQAVENMTRIVERSPQLMAIMGDLIAQNMDWDGADDMAKRLKALLPPEILQMEEMENIPEEARPYIINAMQQMKNMEANIQQGQMVAQEQAQTIKRLELMLEDKQGDHELKGQELQLKKYIEELKQQGEKQSIVLKGAVEQELQSFQQSIDQLRKYIFNTPGNNSYSPIQ